MIWLLLAILTALWESLKDVFSKKSLQNVNEYIVSWSLVLFTVIFLSPIIFLDEIPHLNATYWYALIVDGSLNVLAVILYMKALKASDISITVPMITFTPLFLLITSPLIVREFPTVGGLIGILLIVTGSYVLNIKERSRGYFAPFQALVREKGPRLMLIVAFIWSISSNFDKIGVQNSSPIFWAFSVISFVTIGVFPVVWFKARDHLREIPQNLKSLIPMGLFLSLALSCQMVALQMTLVAYVISIKRTSALLGVLWGYLIFKEKGIKERLGGAIIMIIGVFFIALF